MGRRGFRGRTLLATMAAVVALGAALHWVSSGGAAGRAQTVLPGIAEYQAAQTSQGSGNQAPDSSEAEIARRFSEGVAMLHAKRYEHAATAFHAVLARASRLPEAHVNMGFALVGLSRHRMARDFFQNAIDIRPSQRNAYYGLAIALEELGDLAGAARAMRTFVHLAPPDDPFLRKANAALWEWSSAISSRPDAKSGG